MLVYSAELYSKTPAWDVEFTTCVWVFTVLRYKSLGEEWHSESWSICIVCENVRFMFWGQLCVCVHMFLEGSLVISAALVSSFSLLSSGSSCYLAESHKIIVCPSIKNTLATRF